MPNDQRTTRQRPAARAPGGRPRRRGRTTSRRGPPARAVAGDPRQISWRGGVGDILRTRLGGGERWETGSERGSERGSELVDIRVTGVMVVDRCWENGICGSFLGGAVLEGRLLQDWGGEGEREGGRRGDLGPPRRRGMGSRTPSPLFCPIREKSEGGKWYFGHRACMPEERNGSVGRRCAHIHILQICGRFRVSQYGYGG